MRRVSSVRSFRKSGSFRAISISSRNAKIPCIVVTGSTENSLQAAHGKKEKPNKEADFDVTMILGWEELSESSIISNISDMFEGIRFCTPCHIELRVCHIGSSKRLQAAMKAKYPCKIKMYEGEVKP